MSANVTEPGATRGAWRILLWSGLAILLALPALAMALGAEGVDWSASDFIIMGALLASVGVAIELVTRVARRGRNRRIAIGVVIALFLLVWAELAVGLFGSPLAGS